MSMKVDFSVILPVYHNEGSLLDVIKEIQDRVFRQLPALKGEILLIDDGSQDDSWSKICQIQRENPDVVRAVKLSRNFGQAQAVWCGMERASGRAVCIMSADGQDPAEMVAKMLQLHFEGGHEIVIGTRAEREEVAYRRWTSRFFYTLMRAMAFPNMPEGGFDFMVLGRRAVDALMPTLESHAFFQGKVLQLGFSPVFVPYTRRARLHGTSRWGFGRKITYLLDGVIGNSFVPIRVMSLAGIILALAGFAYAGLIFVDRLAYGNPIKGWAPLMIVVLIIGGFQMLMLGVIGEYVWRVLALVKKQAPYVVEAVLGSEARKEP